MTSPGVYNIAVVLLLVSTTCWKADGYRVLVVYPLAWRSHAILGAAHVRELLKKGHEVTYITPFPIKAAPEHLTQIDISYSIEWMPLQLLNVTDMLEWKKGGTDLNQIQRILNSLMERVLASEKIQTFLQDTSQQFHLVVLDWFFFSELFVGFSALYQCPLVWSTALDVNSVLLRLVDEVPSPLLVEDVMNPYMPPFSFLQRAELLYGNIYKVLMTELVSTLRKKTYYATYTPLLEKRGLPVPAYEDVLYNASMVLTNAHSSLGDAPKLPQNVKAVGGYHIELPTKPLPDNIKKIMDEAGYGVLFFSLGSSIKSEDMPEKLKSDLLKMFGGFKQTVLWKFEEDLPNLPANVHIQKWMPQPSILAHPNLKIFITHGGLLSTTETVHYGVPIIGVPLFGDQFINVNRAVSRGFAVSVDFTWNLADDLKTAVDEVLTNSSYTATAKRLSSLYHDRPLPPAEELVYWLEYAVRTGGAPHLRSAALLLPWYQRLYIDMLAVLVTLVVVTVFGLKLFAKCNISVYITKQKNKMN